MNGFNEWFGKPFTIFLHLNSVKKKLLCFSYVYSGKETVVGTAN